MPLFQSPLGALPARFRRERLLIVGCGDIGLRVVRELRGRLRVLALTSSLEKLSVLRWQRVTPLLGNLDHRSTLRRLAGIATRVIYLAPPPGTGSTDPRMAEMTRIWRSRGRPRSLVYGSTSGVYGDCGGAWVSETRIPNPATARAQRRADAEAQLRLLGRASTGWQAQRICILRIPGIYAPDRPAGTPRERLLKGTPVLAASDDVYTNHVHADDLARACLAALWKGRAQRVYNVNDDSSLLMGDYFDLAAELLGLPRPPRVARDAASATLPLARLSFMGESRRLDNTRLKRELALRLRYPSVREGLAPLAAQRTPVLDP